MLLGTNCLELEQHFFCSGRGLTVPVKVACVSCVVLWFVGRLPRRKVRGGRSPVKWKMELDYMDYCYCGEVSPPLTREEPSMRRKVLVR